MFGYKLVKKSFWDEYYTTRQLLTNAQYLAKIWAEEVDQIKKSRAKWREKAHQYRRQRQLLVEKLKLKETQNG